MPKPGRRGIRKRWPWAKHLFADGAYDRLRLMDKAAFLDFVVEIIRHCDRAKGCGVLPRRRAVERTFDWMTQWRRLVRDYEQFLDVSEAIIPIAMGSIRLRRNASMIFQKSSKHLKSPSDKQGRWR